jgi:O-antigen/teichoic acid export membrane protein
MRIKQLYSVLVWLGIGSIIVNTTISPLFIQYFYGSEFQNASQILAILCIGGLFTSLGYGNGTILLIESHTKLSLVLTIVGALMAIIGGLILTPILGVYGAAISSVLAYLTTAWIAPLFFKASRKLFFLPFQGFIYPFELALAKFRKE